MFVRLDFLVCGTARVLAPVVQGAAVSRQQLFDPSSQNRLRASRENASRLKSHPTYWPPKKIIAILRQPWERYLGWQSPVVQDNGECHQLTT